MLTITVPGAELWNDKDKVFVNVKTQTLSLEHSLVSISKWESKWHKPFIGKEPKTNDQIVDYIKSMTTTQNVDPLVYTVLTAQNIKEVNEYIDDSMTATWFNDTNKQTKKTNEEQITSELIYYWMIALEVPFECQRWHLNRLMTLIRICNIKNKQPTKGNKKELLANNAALNAARREKYGTSG